MLKKFAQRFLNADTSNDGGGNSPAVASEAPASILGGLSIDQEIINFAGSNKFPDFETPTTTPETKAPEAKPTQTPEAKPAPEKITNVKDFNKVLGEADTLAKGLGAKDKPPVAPIDSEKEVEVTGEPQKQSRDLTGFSDHEAKILKRMSNESFEYVAKQLKEKRELETKYTEEKKTYEAEVAKLKEGKTTLPDSYYDHPQAAMLTPEVQQLQATISTATAIENHWKQQLLNIEMGKDWYDLIEDPKTGQIYVASKATSAGTAGSDEWVKNKYQVNDYYNQTQRQSLGLQQQLNTYVAGFKQRHEGTVNGIKAAESKYMPMFNDPKSADYKKVEEVSKEVAKLGINPTNPAYTMLAKSIALNLMLKEVIMQGMQEVQRTEQIKTQQIKAGPNMSSFSGGDNSTSKVNKAPTLADFESLGLPKIKL